MILLSLLSCLVPLVIAYLLISILWPSQSMRLSLPVKISLAVGVGLGVLSCIYFLLLSTFGPSRRGLLTTQIVLLAVLTALFFYKRKSLKPSPATEPVSEPVARSS